MTKRTKTALVTVTMAMAMCIQANASFYGNLKISVGDRQYSSELYWTDHTDLETAQYYVDLEGVADVYDYTSCYGAPVIPLIADHKNQGFDILYDVVPDETLATIEKDGETQTYICREKDRAGVNTDDSICDSNMNYAEIKYPANWIAMYTCNPEGWWTITLTYWEPIEG